MANANVRALSSEARFRISQFTSINLDEPVRDVIDRLGLIVQSNFNRRKIFMPRERGLVEE